MALIADPSVRGLLRDQCVEDRYAKIAQYVRESLCKGFKLDGTPFKYDEMKSIIENMTKAKQKVNL